MIPVGPGSGGDERRLDLRRDYAIAGKRHRDGPVSLEEETDVDQRTLMLSAEGKWAVAACIPTAGDGSCACDGRPPARTRRPCALTRGRASYLTVRYSN
jgi:hypothetical protein